MMSKAIEMAREVSEIQNEEERTVLPFTVVCRERYAFGDTYITSFCCK